jgi:uncharacterized protein YcgI (DUF1989 family)
MDSEKDYLAMLPPYALDKKFFDTVRAARARHNLVGEFIVPPLTARGFVAKTGQTFRVIQEKGPQAAGMSLWNLHNPNEFYNAMRTRVPEGVFISVHTRLWSEVPWFRPMATCVEDTVVVPAPGSDFHHHWLVGSHCSPETIEIRTGRSGFNGCHREILRAIEPFGLKEEDIRDSVNLFQKARLEPKDGKLYYSRSDSKAGDYIEFFAEIDLLVAVSSCPLGDNACDWTMHENHAVSPLRIELYDTGVQPKEFPKWTDWRPTWSGKWVSTER